MAQVTSAVAHRVPVRLPHTMAYNEVTEWLADMTRSYLVAHCSIKPYVIPGSTQTHYPWLHIDISHNVSIIFNSYQRSHKH